MDLIPRTLTFARRRIVAAVVLLCAFAIGAQAQVTINQTFQTSTVTDWTFSNSSGSFTPASGALRDSNRNRWLELTNNGGNEATAAVYNGNFSAAGTSVYAQFNYQMYGGTNGTTIGGDGLTFFLYDASQSFSAGAYGGSMGYAQKTGIDGLSGGYLGVGLDAYGNYSAASEGRIGGYNGTTNPVTESVAVRGPGSGQNGYNYLGGTAAHLGTGNSSVNIDSTSRPTTTNTVQILLTATNQLTVTLAQGGSTPQTVLQMDLSGYARPDLLSFGFTAGTGGATDYILVNNFTVTTLTASKWTNAAGDGNWASNTNWNPSVVPTSGSDILFDNSTVSSNQTINTGANRTVRSLAFDAPFNYTINGNTFTIDNGGTPGFSGIAVTQTHGTGVDTINSALSLNNDINVRNNATGTLNLNGAIATNGNNITFDGTGTGTYVAGAISGTGSVIKNDVGTATLSGANTYSGGTTINSGTLNVNNNTGLGTGGVTLAGGTLGSTSGASINNNVTLTGDAAISGLANSGTLTQSGANRTLVLSNVTQSGAVKLSEGTTARTLTVEVDSGTSSINGVISGGGTTGGNLTKTGAGTLHLGAANTYTGTTTINGGTVELGASDRLTSTGNLYISAAGTLNLNGFSQKVGNLTAEGGATLDFGPTGTANNFVFGNFTAPTSGVLVVNNWENGTDKLATTIAGQTVSSIYISGYGVASEATGTSTVGSYGSAYLLTPTTQTAKEWTGTTSGNWTTGTNWSGGAPTSTQVALFNSLGVARPSVTLNGNVTVAGIQFGNAAGSYSITGTNTITLSGTVSYIQQKSASDQSIGAKIALGANTVADITGTGNLTISGAISGTQNLIKDGTGGGKLILSGANTLSGGVYVNNGVLQAYGSNAVLGTGATTVNTGATLELANGTNLANSMSIAGSGSGNAGALHSVSGSNTLGGTITETAATTIAADAATSLTLTNGLGGSGMDTTLIGAGNITLGAITTGSGGLTMNGSGTATLNGSANSYTGTTTVNSGTLALAKANGSNAIAGNLAINGGAVQLNADNQISDTVTVNLSGTGTFNLNGHTETLGQVTSTSGSSVLALGAGNLTINAVNNLNSNYAGMITGTSASSLNVTGTGKVYLSGNGSGFAGSVNINGGTLNVAGGTTTLGTGAVSVASSSNLQLQGGVSLANSVTIRGTGTTTNGAIENVGGSNSISGAVSLAAASTIESDGGTLSLGGVTLGGNTLTVGGAGDTQISGAISGTGGVTKTDGGTLTLSGTNSFSGSLAVNAGNLRVSGASATLGTSGATIASGAGFQLSGGAAISQGVTVSGTGTSGNGVVENVSGSNTLSGTVTLAAASKIQSTSGTLTLGAISAGSNALTIGGAGNSVVNGVISGSAGLTKTDAGTLTLGGTNTITGGVAINGGTLAIGANNALNSSTNLTISNGATFAVNGGVSQTIAGLTTNSTSTISIGSGARFTINTGSATTLLGSISGAGTLALNGNGSVSLGSNVSFGGTLEIGGSTIGGTPTKTLYLSGTNSFGTLHITGDTILDFGNSSATTLSATNLIIDSGVKVSVVNWVNLTDYFLSTNFQGATPDQRGGTPENQVTFSGYSNNNTSWVSWDHEITPAPEPATYGVFFVTGAIGFLGIVRWRKRRTQKAA